LAFKLDLYLQKHEEGFTQILAEPPDELSPGIQTGLCPAPQVTEHFGQGGGPSTLQEDGFVRSHPTVAVAVGVATFDLLDPTFGLVFSAPTAEIGRSSVANNKIMTAIILSFINSFGLLSDVGKRLSQPGGIEWLPEMEP
jgi:hypothetical protein